jgi:mRNA-degrading endonuclease toxin of MazEF toxin-antitoxin module
VLKKFNNEICLVIPLTKTLKDGIHYFIFDFKGQKSCAILSQIRLIDTKRLKYKTGDIERQAYKNLKQKLKRLLELE